MKTLPMMPRNLRRVDDDEKFAFACHRELRCFTDCCRDLELALTPYDVLRLKNGLGIDSGLFLERYVIIEKEEEDVFPRLYLTMVDDGRASCVFVNKDGCTVYADRPGACRAYPMGRASMRKEDDGLQEFYVLLNEDHCKGFEEERRQTPPEYSSDQGLNDYNAMNDILVPLLQHDRIRQGMRLSEEQAQLFVLCLFDLDAFRAGLLEKTLSPTPSKAELEGGLKDDPELLRYGVDWLRNRFFRGD